MKHRVYAAVACISMLIMMCGCSKKEETAMDSAAVDEQNVVSDEQNDESDNTNEEEPDLPYMTLIGHASVKIKTKDGVVIYIDPYWSGDYEEAADILLMTHTHSDHTNTKLVTTKDTTKVISAMDIHPSMEEYNTMEECGVKITAVPAYNKNHKKESCVGYILEFDDIKLYHAGDTSMIDEMKDLTDLELDYALYPTDGVYNMDAMEATKAADLVGARVNISIHNNEVKEDKLFETFTPEGRLFMEYGSTITLEP